jgi:hypothetical protein
MEFFCAFMKSSIVHVSFFGSKVEKLSNGVAKITSNHVGSMEVVKNIIYEICLCLPSFDVSCVIILLFSVLNQDFN